MLSNGALIHVQLGRFDSAQYAKLASVLASNYDRADQFAKNTSRSLRLDAGAG